MATTPPRAIRPQIHVGHESIMFTGPRISRSSPPASSSAEINPMIWMGSGSVSIDPLTGRSARRSSKAIVKEEDLGLTRLEAVEHQALCPDPA